MGSDFRASYSVFAAWTGIDVLFSMYLRFIGKSTAFEFYGFEEKKHRLISEEAKATTKFFMSWSETSDILCKLYLFDNLKTIKLLLCCVNKFLKITDASLMITSRRVKPTK